MPEKYPHIADKQTLLASYLASYCESVSGANCGDGGDRDFTGDETVLRYGDFVTLDQLTGVNEGYRLRATTAAASAPSAISSQVSALSSTSRFLGVRLDYSNATHDFPMQTYEGDSMSFQVVALRIERFCSCMYASNDYNSIRFQSRFPPILISQKPSYKFSVVGNEGSCPYSTLQVESLVLNKDQFEGFPGLEARCRAQCTRMATCVRYTVRITADGDGMCTMFPSQTENMFAYSRDRSDKVFLLRNTKPGDWARDQASASFQVVERFAFSTRENHFFRIISPLLLTTLDKQPVFYGDELHLVSVDGSITLGAGNRLESVDQGSNTTLPPMRFKIYGRNSTFGTPVRRSERVMLQTMPDSQNEYFRKLTGNRRFNTYIPMFLQLATSAPVAPSGGTQLDYSMLRIMKPFPLSVSRLSAFEWVLNKAPKLDTPAADNVLSFIKQPTMAVTVLQPFSALEMTSNTNGTVVLAVVFSDPVVRTSVPPPQFVGLDWIRPKRLWPNNFAVRLQPTASSVGPVTGNVTNVVYEEAQLQVHLVVTVTFGQQLAVGDTITTTAVNVEGANEQPIFQPTQAVQLNFEPVFQLAFVQWNVTNTTTVLAPFDTLRVATVRADFSEPVFSAASGGSLDVSCFALLGFDVASSGVFAANATILAVTLVPGSNSTAYLLDLSYFQLGPYDSPLSAPMYYVFPTGAGIITREATTARASSSSGSSSGVETADSNRAPLSFWWDIFDGSEDFPLDDFIQNHPVNRESDFNPLDASPEFNWAVGRRLLPSFVASKSAERARFSHRGVAIDTKSRFVRRCLRRAERNASSIFMVDEATATSCSISQSNIDRLTFHGDLLRDPTLQMDLVATGVPLDAKLSWLDSDPYFASFSSGTGSEQTGWVMHSRHYTRYCDDIESPLMTGSILELFDALETIRVGRYWSGSTLSTALLGHNINCAQFCTSSAVWVMLLRYWIVVERVRPPQDVIDHCATTSIDMLRYCLTHHYEDMHGLREELLARWLINHVDRRRPNAWNCVTLVLEWLYPERKPASYDCVHPPRPTGPTVYDKFGVTEEAEEVDCSDPFWYDDDWFKQAAGWDMAPVLSNIDALLGLVPPVPQPDLRVPEDVAQFVLDMPLARHLQRVPAYHEMS
ncbi:hypothetical protein CAOG_008711 [Capsaspora owczarzaki ATCC 30864]|uniref:Uncharacterized protein n=1 Tax=Capsaspora owczarzaki (strain ATCC 30864) TaxID=595528 RepID=A0A0D2WND0_CAPO3|nr:hypothetical protein CAOG_008711 [Capsaspora owczarzaki ATCC 30864]